MKITKAQQKALDKMTENKWQSAYELQVSLSTLYALVSKGFVTSYCGDGSFSFPRIAIKFKKKGI
jgi:hypothetical protein